jgi:DNA-binding MarR family transcriptional regulator
MNNQFAIIYKEEIALLRECKSVTKSVYMALSYHFKTEEKEGVRTRFCCPSYDVISDITGYSKGSIKRAIRELKDQGILTSKKRMGTSSLIYVEYKIDPQEGTTVDPIEGTTVEPSMGSHVKPSEGSHVKPSKGTTVEPTINNKVNNKELTTNINRLILTDKQKEIINKLSSYFGWKGKNYIEELEKILPADCSDYLTDELMLIGAYNLRMKKEGGRVWTGNYLVRGISYWIKNGQGKSLKPNVHTAMFVEEVHEKILQSKKREEPKTEEPDLKVINTDEGQEDFDWLLDHNIKQYKSYPSISNKTMIENMKTSPHCHDLNLQKIKTAIGE